MEQPAEPEPFCNRIRIKSYPVEDYLGIIFVYMGGGRSAAAAPLPYRRRAPRCEVIETANWPFSYRNALDNKQDFAHLPFVHQRGGARPDRARDATATTHGTAST